MTISPGISFVGGIVSGFVAVGFVYLMCWMIDEIVKTFKERKVNKDIHEFVAKTIPPRIYLVEMIDADGGVTCLYMETLKDMWKEAGAFERIMRIDYWNEDNQWETLFDRKKKEKEKMNENIYCLHYYDMEGYFEVHYIRSASTYENFKDAFVALFGVENFVFENCSKIAMTRFGDIKLLINDLFEPNPIKDYYVYNIGMHSDCKMFTFISARKPSNDISDFYYSRELLPESCPFDYWDVSLSVEKYHPDQSLNDEVKKSEGDKMNIQFKDGSQISIFKVIDIDDSSSRELKISSNDGKKKNYVILLNSVKYYEIIHEEESD